ncbi:MAG: response regulator [Magnetococcales bacterium]|nr:response regulator [Magnetococcales bacterium]
MGRTIQVLVIEHDRLNRVLLRGILENVGLQVLDAPGDALGVRILRAAPCDLLITDLLLMQTDGAQELHRWSQEFPELRIIAMENNAAARKTRPMLQEEQQEGQLRILVKPVFRLELLTAIQELFPDWQPDDAEWARHGL